MNYRPYGVGHLTRRSFRAIVIERIENSKASSVKEAQFTSNIDGNYSEEPRIYHRPSPEKD